MILEALNKPLKQGPYTQRAHPSDDHWDYQDEFDPTGNGYLRSRFIENHLRHAANCTCGAAAISMHRLYGDGYRYKEIAQVHGVSVSRVGQLVLKADKCVRRSWKPERVMTEEEVAFYLYQVLCGIEDACTAAKD